MPKIGTKTYGPLYKDPGLPTDEFCACGKRLRALTEHNMDWHQGGGGCAALKWRRWQEASVKESEVERWRARRRAMEAAIRQAAKTRCAELEAQCEAKCKDIGAACEAKCKDVHRSRSGIKPV